MDIFSNPILLKSLVIILTSFCSTFIFIKVLIKYSTKLNLIDSPGYRKIHNQEVPVVGGVAIALSYSLIFLINYFFWHTYTIDVVFACILFSTLIIFSIGLVDDIISLSPFKKFIFQLLAAMIVVLSTKYYSNIDFNWFGIANSDFFSITISIIYIIGITNAINLIDGLDGLAGGVSLIITISFISLSLLSGATPGFIFLLIPLIGSLTAFLIFNKEPAKIFLGDSGSLLLGWIFAISSILYSQKTTFSLTILIPIMVLGLPAFDVIFVMIKRFLIRHEYNLKQRWTTIFIGDQNHLHHLLLATGFSKKKTVFLLYLITSITSMIALYTWFNQQNKYNMLYGIFGVLFLIFFVRIIAEWKSSKKNKNET